MGWLVVFVHTWDVSFLRGERAVTVFISCLPDLWYVKIMYEY